MAGSLPTPEWLVSSKILVPPAVRPLIHGAKASLVPFGNISCGFLTWTFSEGPSSRDDVAPGGLTHTDESSTCLSGIVRERERLSHRPLLT